MPRQIKLNDHLSTDALANRYRQATDPVARSHFQILWLLAQGKTSVQITDLTGYCPDWIRKLARRYNAGGPDAMGDQRHHNPGGQWRLSEEQKHQLDPVLQHPPDDGGLWTGPKVAAWMQQKTGKPVHPQRGWEYLRLLDYTPQLPRPRHHKADAEAQADFKKTLPAFVAEIEARFPTCVVELWAFDEHRIGRLPIVRKVWAKRGSRPVRIVETRYPWLYLYGFVHPQSGRTHCLLLPRMKAALYNQALQDFAQAVGAGAHKQVILVVDGAGSHRSHEVVVPEGLHLLPLPPYSPEWQPAEKVWPLTNEPLVNQRFETLSELEAVQAARCKTLASMTQEVRGRTLFHWWPRITK